MTRPNGTAGRVERALRRVVLGPVEGRRGLSDSEIHTAIHAPFQGSVNRQDYGPRGCAGFVVVPVLFVALLLRGGRRR